MTAKNQRRIVAPRASASRRWLLPRPVAVTLGGRTFAALSFVRTIVALASVATTTLVGALSVGRSDKSVLILLAVAQTLGIFWFALEGAGAIRGWRTATFLLSATWVPLFLVATWAYVISPGLLADVAPSPEPAVATLNLALFAMITAWLVLGGRDTIDRPRTLLVEVDPQQLDQRWLVTWIAVGILGLSMFMTLTGGPLDYLAHLNQSGRRSTGLVYVVWLALALKYGALTRLSHYWATGEGQRRKIVLLVSVVLVLLGLFGQRAFLALMLAQAILLYTLIRKPLSLWFIGPVTVLLIAVITFAVGAIKRYQGYEDSQSTPKPGFVHYLEKRAPHEVLSAYVNNYADGVRLIARGRALVPHDADYEKGRGLERLALQPIPSFIRPQVHVAKPLRPLLESSGGYGYALPIPLAAYVEFGLVGVVLGGVLVGAALVAADRGLGRDHQPLSRLLVLTALAVEIPACLRSSLPRGVSFAALDLLGMWIVARTSLRGRHESAGTDDDGSGPISMSS